MNTKQKIISGLSGVALLLGGALVPIDPAPITVNEWQALAGFYAYEIEESGGTMTITDFHSFKDINDEIRERRPEDAAKYEELMQKVEPTTLLKKLTQ